jgi:hypothetical protein
MWKASDRLYWAFHISEGAVFNYCKIKLRPGSVPENTKEKSPLVFTTVKMGSLKSALSFCKWRRKRTDLPSL